MEIRELNEQDIMECLDTYNKTYGKKRANNKRKVILLFAGLVLLYLYLRLFNTGFSVDSHIVTLKYSTAWIVNCPSELIRSEDGEDRIMCIKDLSQCPYIRVLNIGEGFTHLDRREYGDSGGYNLSNSSLKLHTVKLPASLTWISNSTFEDITTLKKVVWKESVGGVSIGSAAFQNTGIEEIVLPEGVREMAYDAFANNHNLVKVTLPDSLERMYSGAFENCIALEEVTWTDSLIGIPEGTFQGCVNLKRLHNTDSIRSVAYNALSGTQITSEQLPDNVHCFTGRYDEPKLNADDNIWFKDYTYTYDADEDSAFLAQHYALPIEVFQIEADSGEFWLDGKYYNWDMTLDEFLENGNWEVGFVGFESDNKDGTKNYYMEADEYEKQMDWVNDLVVTADDSGRIVSYAFGAGKCQVVLPDGVNNFGMLMGRTETLYGEEARTAYSLTYNGVEGQVDMHVYVDYDEISETDCTIFVKKKDANS